MDRKQIEKELMSSPLIHEQLTEWDKNDFVDFLMEKYSLSNQESLILIKSLIISAEKIYLKWTENK